MDQAAREGVVNEDFSGYNEKGQPMYRNTADGLQCTECGLLDGEHDKECRSAADIGMTLVSDEFQVVEFGPSGCVMGVLSSGHFPVGEVSDQETLAMALGYARTVSAAFPQTQCTYRVRRVTVWDIP